jgi:hypothetical protein
MAISQPITSRRDMLRVFDARIQKTQSDLLEDTELEFGRNMLKTALIESNISFDEVTTLDIVEDVLEVDSALWMVKIHVSESDGWLFVDVHDDRFWIIYSMMKSQFFDKAVDKLLRREGGGLDRLWLPTGEVERIGEMGEFEGVKISYGADEVFPESFIEENLQFAGLSIDGSGQSSRQLYDILKQTDDIDDFLALSRVQIRREEEGHHVRESITNEGSFTTRGGDNIQLHVSTVEQIKDRYARLLQAIEDNHVITATDREQSARAQGAPVVIQFSNAVPDIEEFLSHVVTAKDPFRLWGHTQTLGDNAVKVDGVDAHNGDKLKIEMSHEWMRIYLYEGACGNTALRLFTNIQQYYDPAAELVIEDV